MLKTWPRKITFMLILSAIVLVILFGIITFLQVMGWQQALSKKTVINNESTRTMSEKSISLIQVDLPLLPKTLNKNTPSEPSTIKSIKNIQLTHQKIKTVSAMYQQLISDSSINIEIAWPEDSIERQKIFSFLYQCSGMRFGVLNNQKVTLATSIHQKSISSANTNNDHLSEWLRIAQGQLAKQEHYWLQQYNLSGLPVRLFPKTIDWQLAHILTTQLKGKHLRSLRARYKHLGDHFMLTNIRLNGRLLVNDWILITKQCST